MIRPLAALVLGALTLWSGAAGAGTHVVYTRHALQLDFHDLDLTQAAGQRALKARIADAADQVCGGRPDITNRYTADELKLLVPAYEKCRTNAIRHAVAAISSASGVRLAGLEPGP